MDPALQWEVVQSLDGTDPQILPFLPYLLQDFWELGTCAETVLNLIAKHEILTGEGGPVLDLGCGKGAVALAIAQHYDVPVLGIDAMEAFIKTATAQKEEQGLDNCSFRVGALQQEIPFLSGYHLVLLGAIGPILGSYRETLATVKGCLKPGGFVIIDDAYYSDESLNPHPRCENRSAIVSAMTETGFAIIEEYQPPLDETAYNHELDRIKLRAAELSTTYPKHAHLFSAYVQNQAAEYHALENDLTCVVWVLQWQP